jgi:hypothetical protein
MEVSMIRNCSIAVFVLLAAASIRAQAPPDMLAFTAPLNIEFMSDPISFDTEPVTGAPYSAEAVTDIVQNLADGNRIVRQNKAQISRDSQGRTRREQGFAMFGPLVNGPQGDELRNVQISDPTTGSMIMLDLRSRTAHKMSGVPRMMVQNKIAAGFATSAVRVEKMNVEKFETAVPPPPGAEARGGVMFKRFEAVSGTPDQAPVVESLGTQFMEGVAVEGTRTTMTIPAGQVGNEQPINIVSERWFSPDLKVLVMSRQSDPRFGETTYRLTRLSRSEPSPQLFEIPAGFTIVDPGTNRNIFIEKAIPNKAQ